MRGAMAAAFDRTLSALAGLGAQPPQANKRKEPEGGDGAIFRVPPVRSSSSCAVPPDACVQMRAPWCSACTARFPNGTQRTHARAHACTHTRTHAPLAAHARRHTHSCTHTHAHARTPPHVPAHTPALPRMRAGGGGSSKKPTHRRIVFRPWDQRDMLNRLETFKPLLWFGKEACVGPIPCASRGCAEWGAEDVCA